MVVTAARRKRGGIILSALLSLTIVFVIYFGKKNTVLSEQQSQENILDKSGEFEQEKADKGKLPVPPQNAIQSKWKTSGSSKLVWKNRRTNWQGKGAPIPAPGDKFAWRVSNPGTYEGDCYSFSSTMKKLPLDKMQRNGCQKRLPKALIMGVKKCGTMTLTHYLSLHPYVAINGEIDFPGDANFTERDIEEWRNKMLYSSQRMLSMTGKPSHINWKVSSYKRLKSYLSPKVKFVVIIRDPVVRAISDYVHEVDVIFKERLQTILMWNKKFTIYEPPKELHETFSKTVIDSVTGDVNVKHEIIEKGRYVEKIRHLLEVFNREQLLIVDGEAFVKDPFPIMKQMERFLGIRDFFKREHFRKNQTTGFYCAHVRERPNYTCDNPQIKGRPHPVVENKTLQALYNYYRPFNRELAKEFDIDFPWLIQ